MSLLLLLNPKNFVDPGPDTSWSDAVRKKRKERPELEKKLDALEENVEELKTLKKQAKTPTSPDLIAPLQAALNEQLAKLRILETQIAEQILALEEEERLLALLLLHLYH